MLRDVCVIVVFVALFALKINFGVMPGTLMRTALDVAPDNGVEMSDGVDANMWAAVVTATEFIPMPSLLSWEKCS